ncbi:MAG: ketoacyl-ACP synthase III [bacterium]
MSFIYFEHIGITGISAAVPRRKVDNKEMVDFFTPQELENAINTTGIRERRIADGLTCSSDLCHAAAETLLEEMQIDKGTIDVLIFLSQTPDYHQPSTAPILQHRLGLPKNTASFDINMACSGYVYGLATAFSYASQKGINRVLLLVGETLSKTVSKRDRATALLFGDAGTATIVEKKARFGSSYFSLNSDGSGYQVLIIPAGGYRTPSSPETHAERKYEDGSMRSDEEMFMDGLEVFNFTMREVPDDIKRLLRFAEKDINEIDFLVFHQANRYMTDFFLKKLRYQGKMVPYSLDRYGNTSSASIPLTVVTELQQFLQNQKKTFVISGFGAGLSWGSALIEIDHARIPALQEVE